MVRKLLLKIAAGNDVLQVKFREFLIAQRWTGKQTFVREKAATGHSHEPNIPSPVQAPYEEPFKGYIGASTITNTILGVPYYIISIVEWAPKPYFNY